MSAEVVAYSDPSCPHCRRLKEYLTNHNIPFENRDVSGDARAAEELQRMNAPGVPVVRVGDDVVVGFDPARLDEVLKAHGVSA
jgi:glutaredoxin-like YruB-family protein